MLDNVALPLLFRRWEPREARAWATAWLQRVGLAGSNTTTPTSSPAACGIASRWLRHQFTGLLAREDIIERRPVMIQKEIFTADSLPPAEGVTSVLRAFEVVGLIPDATKMDPSGPIDTRFVKRAHERM